MVEPALPFPPDLSVPKDSGDALKQMVDRGFLGTRNYQEQQWRADRKGAHPDIVVFERLLVSRMANIGVPMFAHEVVRDAKRQADLYALGRTRARPGKSAHNYGLAVDIVHGVKAWALHEKAWALIGHVGKEVATQRGLKVVWGGDWDFYDPAHWELKDWKTLKEGYPWKSK